MQPKWYVFILITVVLFPAKMPAQNYQLEHLQQFVGWQTNLYLGWNLLNAGDLNNDGFDEYISWSVNRDSTLLFYGAFPANTRPEIVFREMGRFGFGEISIDAMIADLNGDGIQEFIQPYFGSGTTTVIHHLVAGMDSVPDLILGYGAENAATGDLNGDGYDDVILARPDSLNYTGLIRIFMGGDPFDLQPDYVFEGDSIWFRLGWDVTTGDLNGDGYDDLVLMGNDGGFGPGFEYIRIYFGSATFDTNYDLHMNDPSQDPETFGFIPLRLESFDYNLDGYEDLFVGGGFIYNGGATFDTIPEFHLIWPDSSFDAYAAAFYFNVGDLNKDGYPDLGIGMPNMFGTKGLTHIRLGGSSGFDEDYLILEPSSGSFFGRGMVGVRDRTGDGVDDLIVGEPGYNFGEFRGRMHFFAGDSTLQSNTVGIEQLSDDVPTGFELLQNYPNPFNGSTTIPFSVVTASDIELQIIDIQGRLVHNYRQRSVAPGSYEWRWDGRNREGEAVASGIYFYRLQLNEKSRGIQTRKLIYLK
ncbi:MAG: FG-GAP-like repeat-containing protein [Calditrichia bacterium]